MSGLSAPGSPFASSYSRVDPQYIHQGQLLGHFDWPDIRRLWWLSFHPVRGLLYCCPILIIPDQPAKHQQYDDLVMRVFYINHADVTELASLVNSVIRIPQMTVQPMVRTRNPLKRKR